MTNPGNAIGTNAAYGGRTSVNALNDALAGYTRGILSGWQVAPKTGLTVSLGGDGVTRDVAIAEDPNGNHTTINNRSEQPVDITIAEAPTIGQRIDVIIGYVQNPPEGSATEADNPAACGMIVVQGEVAASNPSAPTVEDIQAGITADGASGATAYYVVMATISVTEGMTDITSSNITPGDKTGSGSVDMALNPLSDNPVANKVVTAEFQKVEESIGNVESTLARINDGAGVTL